MKPCPTCHGTDFFPIPDSLASACRRCGFVWVGCKDEDLVPGATIQEWAKDIYELRKSQQAIPDGHKHFGIEEQ